MEPDEPHVVSPVTVWIWTGKVNNFWSDNGNWLLSDEASAKPGLSDEVKVGGPDTSVVE